MRQHELFEPAHSSKVLVPEILVTELIALLAQLMLSTLNAAAADEETSDEPDQR